MCFSITIVVITPLNLTFFGMSFDIQLDPYFYLFYV
jgi:hypothetical protein